MSALVSPWNQAPFPIPVVRSRATAFELERTQVEQLEDQLRAKNGVGKKPGSGGGPFGGLAGAVGGMLLGSSGSGSKHTGDGRVGAGERPKEGMMKDALGSMGPAGAVAGGALNAFGPQLHSKMMGKSGPKDEGAEIKDERTESATEKAEVDAQMTGEGEDVAPVSEVAEQKEVDAAEDQEGEGPPTGDLEEKMGKAPDISTADLYKYYTNRLARRARQAAIIADQAVQEAWKQQQLARYWNRQALEAEAAAKQALPAKVSDERSTWQLKVPPGWEMPASPMVSAQDPRAVTIYSGAMSPGLLLVGPAAICQTRLMCSLRCSLRKRSAATFLPTVT
ncbi:unnamed protein product [Symbiodinium necroappetens]|uniref:Uncharacterized protein n=1 Tax=Symbiodinium necroappetens TaxID=1628268 RepID=A0A813AZK0_9DINO|nr:unnamed protein product [Symbiodinium necroappetens]